MLQTGISVLTLCILLTTLSTLSTARQIRISRYNVQVEEDSTGASILVDEEPEINATVREVTPYPAAGYRPGRAFKLPNEENVELEKRIETTEMPIATTTQTELAMDTTTTIPIPPTTTTTMENEDIYYTTTITTTNRKNYGRGNMVKDEETFTGYPARGYQPRVPFNLPTQNVKKPCNNTLEKIDATAEENVTPYPAAGYRPCQPFTLPTEQQQQQQQVQVENTNAVVVKNTNKNPACGVSLNPLAPKPPAGSVDEPDAERVPVTTNTGNGNSNVPIVASVTNPAFVSTATLRGPQPIIWQQPLTVVPQQPFVYTAHLQTW